MNVIDGQAGRVRYYSLIFYSLTINNILNIIILLILAGITISSLTNTGLFGRAKEAKEKTQAAEKNQQDTLSEYEKALNDATAEKLTSAMYNTKLSDDNNTSLEDAYGNTFVVPAGFKIVVSDDTNNATTVDKGIVIEDATSGATAGSQFVWVPVGKIYTDTAKTEENTKTITLGRYEFNSSTGAESAYSGSFVEEDANDASTLKNYKNKAIAKSITNFKNSVKTNGGYYIGRYEARTTTIRNSKENALTQITEKGTDKLYNYVTQQQATEQSQNMYNSNKFTSDLMNSYAWDTAINFLQKCTDQTNYANQKSLNTAPIAQTGTNSFGDESQIDKKCNIFDIASNVREWTTETNTISDYPCVNRGGNCYDSNTYACGRYYSDTKGSYDYIGFRPLLFI